MISTTFAAVNLSPFARARLEKKKGEGRRRQPVVKLESPVRSLGMRFQELHSSRLSSLLLLPLERKKGEERVDHWSGRSKNSADISLTSGTNM